MWASYCRQFATHVWASSIHMGWLIWKAAARGAAPFQKRSKLPERTHFQKLYHQKIGAAAWYRTGSTTVVKGAELCH